AKATTTHAAPKDAASAAADRAFAAIHQAEWKWRVEQRLASDEGARGRVRPELPRVDAASQAGRLAYWQDVLRRLDGIAPHALSAPERINYQVYRAQIAAFVEELRFREYEAP